MCPSTSPFCIVVGQEFISRMTDATLGVEKSALDMLPLFEGWKILCASLHEKHFRSWTSVRYLSAAVCAQLFCQPNRAGSANDL